MEELLKYLDGIAEHRIDDIAVDTELNNEEYISIRNKASEVEKDLMKLTDKFLEYEDLNSKREIIVRRVMYKKGFEDGFKLSRLIHQYVG